MFANISYNATGQTKASEAPAAKPHSLCNRARFHVIAFALCELHLFFWKLHHFESGLPKVGPVGQSW